MRRLALVLGMIGLLGALVAAPAGAAGPERYQTTTTSYHVLVLGTYIHDYSVVLNPCDGTIAMSGGTPEGLGYYTLEDVDGTLSAGAISFTSTYLGPYNTGYTWWGSFPVGGGPLSGMLTGSVSVSSQVSTQYKNHGDYVSDMGGGADAAHSCIGMPIVPKP